MKHIFLIDRFDSLIKGHDSSLALMREALLLGHTAYQTELENIIWNSGHLQINAQEVTLKDSDLISPENSQMKSFNLSKEDNDLIVWMRKDPPVDDKYIQACQLLRLSKVKVLNNPNTLLSCNEKLFALEFPNLIPETYCSNNIHFIKELLKQKEKLIIKPINGMGGSGIFLLNKDDKNINSILELSTKNQKERLIIQEYLPAAKIGDKRIILINGNPIGAVLRTPSSSDNRANMAAGGGTEKTSITDRELEICKTIKPRLQELGLFLVGLDVIGEKITEINITSPTCIEEISHLNNENLAKEIIEECKQ